MDTLTRFAVKPLATMTRHLADVASGRAAPDRVITGARALSTYSERILPDREIWIAGGRIAAIKPAGAYAGDGAPTFDAAGAILAPGLVDPHIHIELSMVTACAYAEAALLNGTTTIFCDSHEIGNVMDVAGVEAMLEDARMAPLSIFLTVPSTVPATSPELETAGGDLTPEKIAGAVRPLAGGRGARREDGFRAGRHGRRAQPRHHRRGAVERGRPVSGHVYGREFVAAYAASGVTDTHEAIDREIADDLLEAGVWVFLRGGTADHAVAPICRRRSGRHRTRRVAPSASCVCTDDRDADDLFISARTGWRARRCARHEAGTAWSMGSLHGATRFGMDGEIGGLGGGRRADLVLLDDDLKPVNAPGMAANSWSRTARSRRSSMRRSSEPLPLSEGRLHDRQAAEGDQADARPARRTGHGQRHPHRAARHHPVHEKIALEPAKDWPDPLRPARPVLRHRGRTARQVVGQRRPRPVKDFNLKRGAVASSRRPRQPQHHRRRHQRGRHAASRSTPSRRSRAASASSRTAR